MSVLPNGCRRIRLELTREPNPGGNPKDGYETAVPLALGGEIDAATWRKPRRHCRVRCFRDDSEQRLGRVARKPGVQWFFDYEPANDADDEAGFRPEKRLLRRANMYRAE